MEKKISIYFFLFFQWLEMKKKKGNEKKLCRTVFGLLPKLYCEKKRKKLYCKGPIVLQRRRDLRADCIAIQYFVL